MLPTGRDFFVAFFGILYAGAVPVPIYPPMRLSQLEEHLRRQAGILRNAGARMLVTVPGRSRRRGAAAGAGGEPDARSRASPGFRRARAARRVADQRDEAATALIQYTSGSTGDPKGVVLSHANLLANIRAMGRAMEASSADVFVSWLPLYHDMGLIGAWLGCLYFAAPLYVMSPLSFLARPESWLWAIHRFRATLSAAPNFAFELCLNKIDDADLQGPRSELRCAWSPTAPSRSASRRCGGSSNGSAVTAFGPKRWRRSTASPKTRWGSRFRRLGAAADYRSRRSRGAEPRGMAEPAQADDPQPLEIVACGQPLPGHEIRIVDELGLRSRRAARRPARVPRPLGDLRLFPQRGEDPRTVPRAAGSTAATAPTWPRVTSSSPAGSRTSSSAPAGTSIRRKSRKRSARSPASARAAWPSSACRPRLRHRAGGRRGRDARDRSRRPARRCRRARRRSRPTSSARRPTRSCLPRRARCRRPRAARSAAAPPRNFTRRAHRRARRAPVWRQILRLWLAGVGPPIRRLVAVARRQCSTPPGGGSWWRSASSSAGFAVMILPRLDWRWRAVRGVARAALAPTGVPRFGRRRRALGRANAMLVFNHSSYMDALVLAAVLPGEPAYRRQEGARRQFFAGPFAAPPGRAVRRALRHRREPGRRRGVIAAPRGEAA